MTKQRILSDRDLGRGMVTVQREGFACALLPTVSYGSRKAAAAAETFDIWIGRVCEVVLSEGCSRQLRERHDKDIYFATPGEIARRQSDATETSKGGKWRMSRASSLLLQVIPPIGAEGLSRRPPAGPCRLFLGPGFRLAARWNRLGETVKTRKKRGKTGKKWARYGLKRVKESGSPPPASAAPRRFRCAASTRGRRPPPPRSGCPAATAREPSSRLSEGRTPSEHGRKKPSE